MNRVALKIALGVMTAGLTIAVAPAVYSCVHERSYEGYYYEEAICGCGHRLFMEVSRDGVFLYSPGHRSRKLLGTVFPASDHWDVRGTRTGHPFRLRFAGSTLMFEDLETGKSNAEQRVRNLWRVWLPAWLPE